MKSIRKSIFFLSFIITLFLCTAPLNGTALAHGKDSGKGPAGTKEHTVPILKELLSHHFGVTTKSKTAQEYFNQGMVLTYGFDHNDAEASFLEAARLDPDCAMAYWGAAFVLGPNINAGMDEGSVVHTYELIQKARSLAKNVTPRELALIEAMATRYGPKPVKDRSSLDEAYAEAMRGVYTNFPDDPDIAVLYAEALMDLHPWDYWTADGLPQPWTPEIREVLEKTIAQFPAHPHGHHLYIHLMENSPTPEVTVKSADVIGTLAPASGHLVHMAGHAYYAAGFYHDCSLANERAIEVDKMLTSAFDTQGLYRKGYVPHVLHYLLASYMMEGRSKDAVRTARTLAASIDPDDMRGPGGGTSQHYYLTPYSVLVRFGLWDDILKEGPPPKDLPYALGMWHYAQGMASIRTGNTEKAKESLDSLQKIANNPSLKNMMIWDLNAVSNLLAIASEVLAGELASSQGKADEAFEHLTRGIDIEENKLVYDEPPPWYFPVRQSLGTVLLKLGRAEEAEAVFRKDLFKNAENPWSLFGLAQSLKMQGKMDEVPNVMKRFNRAWSRADVELTRPEF